MIRVQMVGCRGRAASLLGGQQPIQVVVGVRSAAGGIHRMCHCFTLTGVGFQSYRYERYREKPRS